MLFRSNLKLLDTKTKNMLSLKNSLAVLKKTDALLEGHFVLSSGLHSPQYVQCAKLLSKPNQSKKFINSLAFLNVAT